MFKKGRFASSNDLSHHKITINIGSHSSGVSNLKGDDDEDPFFDDVDENIAINDNPGNSGEIDDESNIDDEADEMQVLPG